MMAILTIRFDQITFVNVEFVCYLGAIHKVYEQLNSTLDSGGHCVGAEWIIWM